MPGKGTAPTPELFDFGPGIRSIFRVHRGTYGAQVMETRVKPTYGSHSAASTTRPGGPPSAQDALTSPTSHLPHPTEEYVMATSKGESQEYHQIPRMPAQAAQHQQHAANRSQTSELRVGVSQAHPRNINVECKPSK